MRPSIEGSGHNVVVLVEKVTVVLAKPPLIRKSKDEVHQDSCVGANQEPSNIPENDGKIAIREDVVRPKLFASQNGTGRMNPSKEAIVPH